MHIVDAERTVKRQGNWTFVDLIFMYAKYCMLIMQVDMLFVTLLVYIVGVCVCVHVLCQSQRTVE